MNLSKRSYPFKEAPDPDVFLSLSQALKETYDEAADELSIDYAEAPPPPTLPPADAEWMRGLLNR